MRNTKLLILIILFASVPTFAAEQPAPATEPVTEPVTKTLMWPDGTRYVGGVVDGKRTGKGTIFWQDGTRFVGNFENDKRSGPGTMILPDGTVYNGNFQNDELVSTPSDSARRTAEMTEPVAQITAESLETTAGQEQVQKPQETESQQEPKEVANTANTPAEKLPAKATTPPTQPVPLYQPVTRLSEQTSAELESMVDTWVANWSDQNVDDYLAHYSTKFSVPGNQSRSQWRALRRSRLTRPTFIDVSIVIEKMEVVGADLAEVTFKQTYKSDRYEDVTRKRLDLVREDGKWLIKKERSI